MNWLDRGKIIYLPAVTDFHSDHLLLLTARIFTDKADSPLVTTMNHRNGVDSFRSLSNAVLLQFTLLL